MHAFFFFMLYTSCSFFFFFLIAGVVISRKTQKQGKSCARTAGRTYDTCRALWSLHFLMRCFFLLLAMRKGRGAS